MDVDRVNLVVFQTLCQYPQCKNLGSGHCLIGRSTVSQHTRQLHHFGEPAAIAFAFAFQCEVYVDSSNGTQFTTLF